VDQHSVSGFVRNKSTAETPDSLGEAKQRELINLSDITVKTYPELLSEQGHQVGLINPLPIWPPLSLTGGFCISGMLTPPTANEWAAPPELQEKLVESTYEIDIRYEDRPYGFIDDDIFSDISIDQLYADIFGVLEERVEWSKQLISSRNPEFCYILFKSIDTIQHCFWSPMNTANSEYNDSILDAYKLVDEFISWVREHCPDANILLFSDHGFREKRNNRSELVWRLAHRIGSLVASVPEPIENIYWWLNTNKKDVNNASPDRITGAHGRPAMWLMAGPDIASNPSPIPIDFEDISATIFPLLGEPVPRRYIGTAIEEALLCDIETADISLDVNRTDPTYDTEQITERLHNLGYVDMIDE
jgi:hypothetical protein